MQPCPECRKPLCDFADACPHCGRPCADLLEARLREAEQLERTARLCALVMPLAALAAFCLTSIPAGFVSSVKLLGGDLATSGVRILAVAFYTLLVLAFLALPIIVVVSIARATLRCLQNR